MKDLLCSNTQPDSLTLSEFGYEHLPDPDCVCTVAHGLLLIDSRQLIFQLDAQVLPFCPGVSSPISADGGTQHSVHPGGCYMCEAALFSRKFHTLDTILASIFYKPYESRFHRLYVHASTIATCTYAYQWAHNYPSEQKLTAWHTLTDIKEKWTWKDEVIVKHTPLYLYLSHTVLHKAAYPSSFCLSLPLSFSVSLIDRSAKLYEGHQAGPASRVQSDSGERSDGSVR